jgi:ribosome maturation factor RimP
VNQVQSEIEARLAQSAPEIEVLVVERSGEHLRVFIDHPQGVTLAHCELVTNLLGDYRESYAVEVSSPGEDRPLSKPEHFRRFLGHRARLRLRTEHDGHKTLTGELVGASEDEVTIAAADAVVAVPYEQITRSNLVPGH